MNQTGYIKLDGRNIYFNVCSPEKLRQGKELIIFLHEGLGCASQWRSFPEDLCNACDMPGLVYDRYGYGRSGRLQEDRPLNFLQNEARYALHELIGHFSPKRPVHLFGHSDGGSIALAAASYYPQKVKSLIVVAPHVFIEDISVQGIEDAQKGFEQGWLRTSLQKHHGENTDAMALAWFKHWLSPGGKNWSMEGLLPGISAPLLFIQGENDNFGSMEQWRRIKNNVRGKTELKLLGHCGHHPHLERKKQVIQMAIEFYLHKKS